MNLSFHLSAKGIGDAVCGLYAACGAADAGHTVTFFCRHSEWFAGISHPGVTLAVHPWPRKHEDGPIVHPPLPSACDANCGMAVDDAATGDAAGWEGYRKQLASAFYWTCGSRAEWYCRMIAEYYNVDDFKPARPAVVPKREAYASSPNGYVVLSPFCDFPGREWASEKWAALAKGLNERGIGIVVVGSVPQKERIDAVFADCNVTVAVGQEPDIVLGIMSGAKMVYGNDSGIIHLAGLYGVPATALLAPMRPEFLYGDVAPSVRGVSARMDCEGCAWDGNAMREKGCASDTHHACLSLQSLGVERVLGAVA